MSLKMKLKKENVEKLEIKKLLRHTCHADNERVELLNAAIKIQQCSLLF